MAERRLAEPAGGGGQARSWIMVENPGGGKPTIYCIKSINSDQIITGLRTAAISDFHDDALATATKEINAILGRVQASNRESRDLAFINTGEGLLLAWTQDAVSAADDLETISRALSLDPVGTKA